MASHQHVLPACRPRPSRDVIEGARVLGHLGESGKSDERQRFRVPASGSHLEADPYLSLPEGENGTGGVRVAQWGIATRAILAIQLGGVAGNAFLSLGRVRP